MATRRIRRHAASALAATVASGRATIETVAAKYRPYRFNPTTLLAEEFEFSEHCPLPTEPEVEAPETTTETAAAAAVAAATAPDAAVALAEDTADATAASDQEEHGENTKTGTEPEKEYIRLCELYPPDNEAFTRRLPLSEAPALRLRVFSVELSQAPRFEYLSYAWEGDDRDYTIYLCGDGPEEREADEEGGVVDDEDEDAGLGGQRLFWFDVTDTLGAALRQVRKKDESVILWVDQICVDLFSAREKAAQVRLAPKVLERAERLLAYLGDSVEGTEDAFKVCQEFGEEAKNWGLESWDGPQHGGGRDVILSAVGALGDRGKDFADICKRCRARMAPASEDDVTKGIDSAEQGDNNAGLATTRTGGSGVSSVKVQDSRVRRLFRKIRIRRKKAKIGGNDSDDDDSEYLIHDTGIPSIMWRLFCQPWFHRAWVLQEFAIAREIILIRGAFRIEASRLYLAWRVWHYSTWLAEAAIPPLPLSALPPPPGLRTPPPPPPLNAYQFSPPRSPPPFFPHYNPPVYYPEYIRIKPHNPLRTLFVTRERYRRMKDGIDRGPTYWEWLNYVYAMDDPSRQDDSSMFDCANRRDRLYALLPLASDAATLGIQPDYDVDVPREIIFAKAAQALIRAAENLDVFGLVSFPKSDKKIAGGLPSWVPDFAHDVRRASSWAMINDEKADDGDYFGQTWAARVVSSSKKSSWRHAFSAADGEPLETLPAESPLILGLTGFYIDEITEVGTPCASGRAAAHISFVTEIRLLCALSAAKMQAAALSSSLTTTVDADNGSNDNAKAATTKSKARARPSSPRNKLIPPQHPDPIYRNSDRRSEALWRIALGDIELTSEENTARRARATAARTFRTFMAHIETREHQRALPHSTPPPRPPPLPVLPPPPPAPAPDATPTTPNAIVSPAPAVTQPNSTLIPVGSAASQDRPEERLISWRIDRMRGKRPFITKRKGYVGLGPSTVQPGDVVVVFGGGQTPFVVRPLTGRQFFLLGDAYVDGIMDGEAVKALKAEGKRRDNFFLV